MKFRIPCCIRSVSVGKREKSLRIVPTFGTSSLAIPFQSVAQ